MKKDEIRRLYREKRASLSNHEKEKRDDLLLIRFQQLGLNIPSFVMTYSPIEQFKEFDPQLIITYCSFKNPGLKLIYPVMVTNGTDSGLIAVAVKEDTIFTLNNYGIEEPVVKENIVPAAIDMVIVPLVSFDKKGNRVGYGKGYYDRFLKSCSEDCLKIGFSYFAPVDKVDDVHEFDIPLNYGITPETGYSFV